MSRYTCKTCKLPVKRRFYKRGRYTPTGVWIHVGVRGVKSCGRKPIARQT